MRFRTPTERLEFESDAIKGSRFVAIVAPAADEAAAMGVVRETEALHRGADHCCGAWRLHDGRTRSWDAAEPRGSAGRPILAQIEGHEVHDVVVVVVRYFGGTKLGVGGLVRAYGGAAGMALDRVALTEVGSAVALAFDHAYADTNAVQVALAGAGARVVDARYDDAVHLVVRVDEDAEGSLVAALRDATAGRVRADRVEP